MKLLDDQWSQLFRNFEHTAFRLEVRDVYNVDYEHEDFRRFLAGEPPRSSKEEDDWYQGIRKATAEGRRYFRVRVVTVPLTDYSRWLVDGAMTFNNPAGEDIRYLDRADAAKLDLPNHDYWLFDSRILVRMHFDDDDRPTEHEIIEDPREIVQHNYWRDVAWHHCVRVEDFAAAQQDLRRV